MQYWDTSALFKLYFPESNSQFFIDLVEHASGPICTSQIAPVELYCTLLRKEREGSLKSGGAQVRFRNFQYSCDRETVKVVPYDGKIVTRAEQVAELAYAHSRPILIRSLDLIHLATALVVGADTFVTSDARLRDLAMLVGVNVQS